MKRRLSLAGALLHEPSVIILDEPTVGIDPLLRQQIWQELYRLRASLCAMYPICRNTFLLGMDCPSTLTWPELAVSIPLMSLISALTISSFVWADFSACIPIAITPIDHNGRTHRVILFVVYVMSLL